jgi:hypothetical protein
MSTIDKKTFDDIKGLAAVKNCGESVYKSFVKTFGAKKTEAYRIFHLKRTLITA